jgi:hypothetical protein
MEAMSDFFRADIAVPVEPPALCRFSRDHLRAPAGDAKLSAD